MDILVLFPNKEKFKHELRDWTPSTPTRWRWSTLDRYVGTTADGVTVVYSTITHMNRERIQGYSGIHAIFVVDSHIAMRTESQAWWDELQVRVMAQRGKVYKL